VVVTYKESVLSTIVKYVTRSYVLCCDDVRHNFVYILKCGFWYFKSCIDGFNFCKSIVQVYWIFLTKKIS